MCRRPVGNGTSSYVYVQDFLDNFFDVSLVVIFKDTSINDRPQTLIHTKYILIELYGTELQVSYNISDEYLNTTPSIQNAQSSNTEILNKMFHID